jgi:methylenetetrahydrofolate dehydrogenase (NADP+)/methenyltetrahydrofolate cyclohydrolase
MRMIEMPGKIIDGKKIAQGIKDSVREGVSDFRERYKKVPSLHVILIGNDPASEMYVRIKEKAAEEVGIKSVKHEFESITEKDLLGLIDKLNRDESVNGILVQLPLPKDVDDKSVLAAVDPEKDVDGFHALNMGSIFTGDYRLVSCTAAGIIRMIESEGIDPEGKEAVIVGSSNVVGKPLAIMLVNKEATVTMCHIKTKNIPEKTRTADILVSATGVPKLIKAEMVKEGATVIDVGISKVDGKIVGDVDFENVKEKASRITPVPGGVGPMTVAMLMSNTLDAAKRQSEGVS